MCWNALLCVLLRQLKSAAATAGSIFAPAGTVAEAYPACAGHHSVAGGIAAADSQSTLCVCTLHAGRTVRALYTPATASTAKDSGTGWDVCIAAVTIGRVLVAHKDF